MVLAPNHTPIHLTTRATTRAEKSMNRMIWTSLLRCHMRRRALSRNRNRVNRTESKYPRTKRINAAKAAEQFVPGRILVKFHDDVVAPLMRET